MHNTQAERLEKLRKRLEKNNMKQGANKRPVYNKKGERKGLQYGKEILSARN